MGKASFRIHGTTHDHRNTELERHPEVLGISGLYFGLIIKKMHKFATTSSSSEHRNRPFAASLGTVKKFNKDPDY